jgi:mannose-1-phosphate guanylyltransferase
MNYAIILAGGEGMRFWPLSTNVTPKQFLNLYSAKPLLLETIKRIGSLIRKENVYIATNNIYKNLINKCLKNFPMSFKNFLFEPQAKNTFAPICILTNRILAQDQDAIVIVLPSDHYIKDKPKFLKDLKLAIEEARRNSIITLGIIPKGPETGFGYIRVSREQERVSRKKTLAVEKFIEKPDLKTAQRLIRDKRYYWNAGIFIFKAKTIMEEIRRYQPRAYKILCDIKNESAIKKLWGKFASISLDYAIMEKTKKIKLIPCNCGWSDLGSWKALEEITAKDRSGNISKGNHVDFDSRNISVWSEKKPVVTLGLKDIIIIDSENGLLVCHKDKTQDVKRTVQVLKKRKLYR